MRNRFAIALWAWIPFFWQPLLGQPPSVGVKPDHNQKQQSDFTGAEAKPDKKGTRDSTLFVDPLSHPKSAQEAEEDKKSNERKAFIDSWTFRAAVAVAFFTGLLVIVGWRGVRAANRTLRALENQTQVGMGTLKAIERQVGVMEAQTKLMAVQFHHWVEIENWKGLWLFNPTTGIGGRQFLIVRGDVVNKTNFPITLNRASLSLVNSESIDKAPATHTLEGDYFLPPRSPYSIGIRIPIADERLASIKEGESLELAVTGSFTHTGILGATVEQKIAGSLMYGTARAVFEPEVRQ